MSEAAPSGSRPRSRRPTQAKAQVPSPSPAARLLLAFLDSAGASPWDDARARLDDARDRGRLGVGA